MNKKTIIRSVFALLLLYFILNIQKFIDHFRFYFSNQLINWTITNSWFLVAIHSAFFILFIFLLRYRKKVSWKEKGIYIAFIISLFIEMYGFPLTIYLTTNYFLKDTYYPHDIAYDIKVAGFTFGINDVIVFGGLIVFIGTIYIIIGWRDIYKNIKKDKLVTSGIYKYSRHPQYFGIILIVIGWIIIWPTILTLVMGIILCIIYYRLCFKEEEENKSKDYLKYKKETPFFI